MRIALIGFFCAEYPIALANALAKSNDVTLFLSLQDLALRFPGVSHFPAWLQERRIVDETVSLRLIDHPAAGDYLRKLRMAYKLVPSIRELQPDVVHYQSGGNPWVPLAMPWLRQFPLVATIHDVTHHTGDWPPKTTLAPTNFLVTRMAHQIIVHGRQQADILSRTYRTPRNKIHVVPMGSFPLYEVFSDGESEGESPVILFFGRLRAYKGVEVLIRAAPLIAARVPHVRIVIAGAGECKAVHKAAAEHPEWFEVHNRFIRADEVPGMFRKSAVVVLPYLDATQSAVVPLAYLFGKPVVATKVGSIPEIVEDGKTGWLVEPGDERGLADAVVRLLLEAETRERMGRAAAAKIKDDLSGDAVASKTLAVYHRARECARTAPEPPEERWR